MLKKRRRVVLNCARRWGKSFFLCVLAITVCLRKKYADVKYLAPTGKAVKKIIQPIIRRIIEDCPKNMRPEWNSQDGCYYFPAPFHSVLHVGGCDNGNHENFRGQGCDLWILDEAGFISELNYIVDSILMPQTIDTDGTGVISSTPPKTPAHDFVYQKSIAELSGNYLEQTILQNPRLTAAKIAEYIQEAGGLDSDTCQREYFCKVVTDQDSMILKEFAAHEGAIVREHARPVHFCPQTVGDLGFIDLSGYLFGYFDFKAAVLVIEDELIFERPTSKTVSDGILAKEMELWGVDRPVRSRFTDGDLITINDMSILHKTPISPVKRDNLEGGVNEVRLHCINHTLAIHPRCKSLIAHCKNGIWDKARRKFERSGKFGHFDLLAALIYFARHVDKGNPYPPNYNKDFDSTWVRKPDSIRKKTALARL